MNKLTDSYKSTTRPLEKISFYRDVVALFRLSRKLKTSPFLHSCRHHKTNKSEFILNDFSERLLKLPMAIAEAEVTRDELKKIAIHLDVKSHISDLLTHWSLLKRQLAVPSEWALAGDQMIKRLPKNYGEWSQSLTCKN